VRTLKLGFTGTRHGMDEFQKESIALLFTQLLREYDFIEFHHGDCIGADAQAATILNDLRNSHYSTRTRVRIVCHPGFPPNHPEETKFRAFTDFNDEVRDLKPFIARDHDIVDETEEMVATPVTEDEEVRSGTWTTVRYARKQNRKVTVLNPKKTIKFDPHAMPVKTNAVAGETNLFGPTHRQRGIR
jgi:hypothetical protein